MDSWMHEFRYSVRMLIASPGFTAIAVLTLALGIGASTAIFTVVDAVVLKSLPYRAGERLAVLWVDFGEQGQSLPAISSLDLRDLEQMSTRFEGFAAGTGSTASLTGIGDPEQVDLGRITYDFFDLLGVEPMLGRSFLPGEDVMGGPDVVILGNGLWQRRFGGDASIVGRPIDVNGAARLVVGVLPPDFRLLLPAEAPFLKDSELWAPLQDPYEGPRNRTLLTAFGRLKDGVSFEQAQDEVNSIALRLREQHLVHEQSDTRIRVVPLHQDLIKDVRPPLLALFAAVGLVLLIACGNVANLLLARATLRERELAIRASLGANRGRIVRQLLMESAVLSAAAGAAGLLLASWTTDFLLSLQPTHLPRLESVTLGGSAFGFAAAVSALTVMLFGVLPAARASRPAWRATLGRRSFTPGAFGSESLRRGLVVGEVAVSLVLLIGVGLLLRTFVLIQDVRPGFDPEGVLTFRLFLPPDRYPSPPERVRFHEQLLEELAALPGVQSAGAVSQLPLTGAGSQAPYAYDEETAQNWESATADARTVTDDYFNTARIRLRDGRFFDARDGNDSRLVVIVDEVLARKAWPAERAVGQQLMLPVFAPEGIRREWLEVVGVVEHARLYDLSRDGREQVYFPIRQSSRRSMDVLMRTDGDPTTFVEIASRTVHSLDGNLPVHEPRPWSSYVAQAMAQPRFTLILGAIFGGLALFLAAVALFGLVSYIVGQRIQEFGLRIALGAQASGIFRLVIRQGLRLTLLGVAIGVPCAMLAARALSSMLVGVRATDPLTFVAVSVLLAGVALLACYFPARRATRIDPVRALRCE